MSGITILPILIAVLLAMAAIDFVYERYWHTIRRWWRKRIK